jgi:hypothetical protein
MKNVPPDGNIKRSTGSIRTAWRATIGSRPETDRALQHTAVQLGAFFSIPTENSDESVGLTAFCTSGIEITASV